MTDLFLTLMDAMKITDPHKAIGLLETYRGQGQDDAIDAFQNTLQNEINGVNQDLVELWQKRMREE